MGRGERLSIGEFVTDLRLVVTAPARRFALIRERGAPWGSLLMLILPAYFGFQYAGGIYFAKDPFPGYAFVPPLVIAFAAVYLKLYVIHAASSLLLGRRKSDAGSSAFSGLKVVFGYTSLPSLLAIIIATALFLLFPEAMGDVAHRSGTVGVILMVALGVALFIWHLILVVLAMRTVYPMRDLKIVAGFFLGSVLMVVPAVCTLWIVRPAPVEYRFIRPLLSDRILRFIASDPDHSASSESGNLLYADWIAFHLREPERFELVAFVRRHPSRQAAEEGARSRRRSMSFFNSGKGEYLAGRILGLPGDTVELVGGRLRINSQFWDEPYLAADCRTTVHLPAKTLGPGEYLVLPEDRNLLEELKDELVVERGRLAAREILCRWPLGWWMYRPGAFLTAYPAR